MCNDFNYFIFYLGAFENSSRDLKLVLVVHLHSFDLLWYMWIFKDNDTHTSYKYGWINCFNITFSFQTKGFKNDISCYTNKNNAWKIYYSKIKKKMEVVELYIKFFWKSITIIDLSSTLHFRTELSDIYSQYDKYPRRISLCNVFNYYSFAFEHSRIVNGSEISCNSTSA